MAGWPLLKAIEGAVNTLKELHPDWIIGLATNAADSTEKDIRKALTQVGINRFIDKVYGFRKIGYPKPAVEFYQYILNDLDIDPKCAVMVGDHFQGDVKGANRAGIKAVWFNEKTKQNRMHKLHRTIYTLKDLPRALAAWE